MTLISKGGFAPVEISYRRWVNFSPYHLLLFQLPGDRFARYQQLFVHNIHDETKPIQVNLPKVIKRPLNRFVNYLN